MVCLCRALTTDGACRLGAALGSQWAGRESQGLGALGDTADFVNAGPLGYTAFIFELSFLSNKLAYCNFFTL